MDTVCLRLASAQDIAELIRLRIAFLTECFGNISDCENELIERQLRDYFERQLKSDLIAFVAEENKRIVSVAFLHLIEMPASLALLNGFYGEVLNVYTEPEFRGRGFCPRLIKNLIEYGKHMGLGKVDLRATKEGYPIYKKIGFADKEHRCTDMTYKY